MSRLIALLLLMGLPLVGFAAEQPLTLLTMQPGEGGEETYSTSIQILLIMTLLSLLPAILMTMTSFTPDYCGPGDFATSDGYHADTFQPDFDWSGVVHLVFYHVARV